MTMESLLSNMNLIFTSLYTWISDIIEMFFTNPVTFILFAIPISTFLIVTVIMILKSLFR